MLNYLRGLIGGKKEKPDARVDGTKIGNPNAGLHPAELADIKFIFDSIQREANAGHFNSDLLFPIAHPGLYKQIFDSITTGCSPTSSGQVPSWFYVSFDAGVRAGFYWLIEERSNLFELYMVAVEPSFRNRGIGKSILEHVNDRIPIGAKIKARLYRPSAIMLKMLVADGFARDVKQGKAIIHVSKKC
ncbi:GNAT family N-acetyltransferase [Ectothiorhodospira lacustris]|uniref:GNAT family N-acetyltransferase n=1 Tax=Ectothiorhodospira lacustris TaxID=2899127 RepID=UPI001EE8CD29|nr:GNAT family N-acetyltransferase [Ectothiorhodospira lacustris]MCG5501876.1 GNAT family N-acetyltransferase [Ectothiorhodospira lacustris]